MSHHIHHYTKAFLMNNLPIVQIIRNHRKYCSGNVNKYATQTNIYKQTPSCKQKKMPKTKCKQKHNVPSPYQKLPVCYLCCTVKNDKYINLALCRYSITQTNQ